MKKSKVSFSAFAILIIEMMFTQSTFAVDIACPDVVQDISATLTKKTNSDWDSASKERVRELAKNSAKEEDLRNKMETQCTCADLTYSASETASSTGDYDCAFSFSPSPLTIEESENGGGPKKIQEFQDLLRLWFDADQTAKDPSYALQSEEYKTRKFARYFVKEGSGNLRRAIRAFGKAKLSCTLTCPNLY
jgi:hypothetical protein